MGADTAHLYAPSAAEHPEEAELWLPSQIPVDVHH
jgi:hypothetical protein